MKRGLLAVLIVGVLAAPSWADDVLPNQGASQTGIGSGEIVGRAAERVMGRMLGILVWKGMTDEQLELVLGGEYCVFFLPSTNTSSFTVFRSYYKYGLNVYCTCDKDSVLRVDRITFWPIFNDSSLPIFVTRW